MMGELTTFLEKIAGRQSSFVIFEGRVYSPEQRRACCVDCGVETIVYANTLCVATSHNGMLEFNLVPSLTLADFERLDERVQRAEIGRYCTEYVRREIDKELGEEGELHQEKRKIFTLRFIIDKLLPFILSRKYKSDEGLTGEVDGRDGVMNPVDRAKQEISARLTQDFGIIREQEVNVEPAERLRQIVLAREKKEITQDSVIGNQPLFVVDRNDVYVLEPVSPRNEVNKSFVFTLNGGKYAPSNAALTTVPDLSEKLLERKKREWRIAALERSQDAFDQIRNQIKTDTITDFQMQGLAKRNEYDLGNCGFVLNGNIYYVYVRVPKFATQDGRGPAQFWPFEETRVAISVGWNDRSRTAYSSGESIAIERREHHPCLKNRTREEGFCSICILDSRNYDNTPAGMVRKLSDAVTTVREPLSKQSLDRHSGHTYFGDHLDDILRQGSLSRQQAIKQGYEIVEVIEQKAQ